MKPEDLMCTTASEIVKTSAEIIAQLECMTFIDNVTCDVDIKKIESPIEQVLFVALHAVSRLNGFRVFDSVSESFNFCGYILCVPQFSIGKYRADFMLQYFESGGDYEKWIIEADGHAFHDKDERQRRYEKKRERYIQSKGYKIMRFTGSEIIENPYKVAAEVIHNVTGQAFDYVSFPDFTKEQEHEGASISVLRGRFPG